MKKKKPQKPKRPSQPTRIGYDLGWPHTIMLVPSIDFNAELRASRIVGCAYAEEGPGGERVPCIALVAEKPEPLVRAFNTFKTWTDLTGPGALDVHIVHSGKGYDIAIGPDAQHLIWRMRGIDRTAERQLMSLSYIKHIDTRHPLFDMLEEYSKQPIAPVIFTGVTLSAPLGPNAVATPDAIRPIPNLPSLRLLSLPINRSRNEAAANSVLGALMREPRKVDLESSRKEYIEHTTSPSAVSERRERILWSIFPATIHALRKNRQNASRVAELATKGFRTWQIEQAIIHCHVWQLLNSSQRQGLKKSGDYGNMLDGFVEFVLPDFSILLADENAILSQATRDLRHLLRELGVRSPPQEVSDAQALLAEKGYGGEASPP